MALLNLLTINAQSLTSFSRGIATTNRNINNLFNEDYARERALFSELPRYGVDVERIERIFDQRYFDRYLRENQSLHYHQELGFNLAGAEAIFNDIEGSGFADELEEYYAKLNDLINEPESIPVREEFLNSAALLIAKMQGAADSLDHELLNLHTTMEQEVEQINQLTQALAKVNKSLSSQLPHRIQDQEERNALLNRRDALLKELSNHLDTKVRYNDDGSVDLSSAKGHPLVVGERSFQLELRKEEVDLGGLTVQKGELFIDGVWLGQEFHNGTLGAKIAYQDHLHATMERLNTLALEFKEQNNTIHRDGYGLDNSTDLDLFVGTNVRTLALNQEIVENPEKVAASSEEDAPSNNENAKRLYDLKEQTFANLDGKGFHDYYALAIVAPLAHAKAFHDKMGADSATIVEALESKLQEISGVNMDEELTTLMELQYAYQAAARVISVTDELFETTLGMVG
ncbi:MAG: flagellar hook-associated protein FlgK [Nitratiruptor sp.]|nr:flagellar hook-associated protein FlgK [Nitratiruptor sp.]NPA84293.1 flagellar hook-associated protein FlgK [Campylobacterota bacterium]